LGVDKGEEIKQERHDSAHFTHTRLGFLSFEDLRKEVELPVSNGWFYVLGVPGDIVWSTTTSGIHRSQERVEKRKEWGAT